MDWLTFMEKKRAELMNTGHIMDDETFITHLLNSLPQTEYEGAIFVIKDKLRKGQQVLEDKYQAMKHTKGWEEEEDDYALFASPSNKKGPKKAFKGQHLYTGFFIHKYICDRSLSGDPFHIVNPFLNAKGLSKCGSKHIPN